MPLTLGVLLDRVGDRDGPVAEELAVHRGDGGIGRLKGVEGDKSEATRVARVRVAHDLGR